MLIKLIIPEISSSFDVFIPVNELIWKIKRLLVKSVTDITHIPLNPDLTYELLNKDTGRVYQDNDAVIDTDIRNGSELFLIVQNIR